jgi:hypothetical protein
VRRYLVDLHVQVSVDLLQGEQGRAAGSAAEQFVQQELGVACVHVCTQAVTDTTPRVLRVVQ